MNGDDGGNRSVPGRPLREVRSAQLRARALRWAVGKSALGMLFLLGALSYPFGPEPHSGESRFWMTALVVLSTVNVGLGLRTLSRVRPGFARVWLLLTLGWGALAAALIRILLSSR